MNEIYGRVPGGEKYLSLPLICGLAKISGVWSSKIFFWQKCQMSYLLMGHPKLWGRKIYLWIQFYTEEDEKNNRPDGVHKWSCSVLSATKRIVDKSSVAKSTIK